MSRKLRGTPEERAHNKAMLKEFALVKKQAPSARRRFVRWMVDQRGYSTGEAEHIAGTYDWVRVLASDELEKWLQS